MASATLWGQAGQIERQVEALDAPTEQVARDREVLQGYTAAMRATLQTKSQAPFRLAGLEIYERLAQIEASLARCEQDHPHPLLAQIRALTQRRQSCEATYQRLRRQQACPEPRP